MATIITLSTIIMAVVVLGIVLHLIADAQVETKKDRHYKENLSCSELNDYLQSTF